LLGADMSRVSERGSSARIAGVDKQDIKATCSQPERAGTADDSPAHDDDRF